MIAYCDCYSRANAIAVAFCATEPNLDASVVSVDIVLKKCIAGVVDDIKIDIAIVIKITSSRTTTDSINSDVKRIRTVYELSVLIVIKTVAIGFLWELSTSPLTT